MDPNWAPYGVMAELLDSLNVAVCVFDGGDRTMLWNRAFLRCFPEHDGAVHEGEPYRANLERFYRARLDADELPEIERYIADGLARHRMQSRPFVFEHRGQWLRVASLPLPGGGRIRVWTPIAAPTEATVTPRAPAGAGDSAILANVADGLMLLGADDRITQVNDECLQLYGLAGRDEMLGRRYEEVLAASWRRQSPGPVPQDEALYWARVLIEPRRFAGAPFEVLLPHDRWLRVIEQRDAEGVAYSTHIDISQLKRQERRATQARDAAESSNAAKSAFLAMMSHEVRTPLNGIIGMNNLLLDTALDERQRFYVETVRNSSESLLGIINDVLDFSKLEAGKLSLESIPFSLDAVIDGAMRLMAPRAAERGLRLERRGLGAALPPRLLGDPLRIRQVLLNLLSNAIKFTEAGSVTVAAGIGPEGDVLVEVSDTGIGFDPREIDRLFERFEQADNTISRRFGGTGLGLNICRLLVEMMAGSIGAEPCLGGGSRVWFALPLRPALSQAAAPVEAAPIPAEARGGHVLVVDDNLVNREIVREVLSRAGFEVEAVESGQAALDAIACRLPDLVLMDMRMAEMDGLETTRRIRAMPGVPLDLPVIALTASVLEDDHRACFAAGMIDYVTKPFEPAALVRTVARWVWKPAAG